MYVLVSYIIFIYYICNSNTLPEHVRYRLPVQMMLSVTCPAVHFLIILHYRATGVVAADCVSTSLQTPSKPFCKTPLY